MDQISTSGPGEEPSPFVPYDPEDTCHAGAAAVIGEELAHVRGRVGRDPDQPLVGLALSGGGIRSATFGLGVLQALAAKGWLGRVDYLSTVSGGGYIGASLTWLLHRRWGRPDAPAADTVDLGVTPEEFPYGTPETLPHERGQRAMLRFLRQHGSYLTPGGCLNGMALFAVLARGIAVSLLVHLSLLVFGFAVLIAVGVLPPLPPGLASADTTPGAWPNAMLVWAMIAAGFALLLSLGYAIGTRIVHGNARAWYRRRRGFECGVGRLWTVAFVLALIGAVPAVLALLDGWLDDTLGSGAAEVGSILTGILSALAAFKGDEGRKRPKLPLGLLAWVAAVLLLFGVLIGSYEFAIKLGVTAGVAPDQLAAPFWLLLLGLIVGRFANLNYLSIHRYYRDRLMEAFMPDAGQVVGRHRVAEEGAPAADATPITAMCRLDQRPGPYHLVNTNLILVGSKISKFRGRGGDNFVISPLFSGSNATGWVRTGDSCLREMTLATAMAISGAAVNPAAGAVGEGPTRRPLLSALMTLLNLRLGYWIPNPAFGAKRTGRPRRPGSPDFIKPGLSAFLPGGQNEQAAYLQLSDGGHFENLALYELLRRRVELIVVSDAAADLQCGFGDLANLLEKARLDFGVEIEIDVAPLIPRRRARYPRRARFAEAPLQIGTIRYPAERPGEADAIGLLVYLKTTLYEGLPGDLYGYRTRYPEFPDQSTADQFFDEKQFEAYRLLGHALAGHIPAPEELFRRLEEARGAV